ncbi:MAG: hypothetical protein AAF927_08970 [Bacteroidota bacterium]
MKYTIWYIIMPDRFTHIDPPSSVSVKNAYLPLDGTFVLNQKQLAYCAKPISWVGNAAIACLIVGLGAAVLQADIWVLVSLTSALSVFGTFYVFGYGMLYRYQKREKNRQLELDNETQMLYYQSPEQQFLFKKEQVVLCVWKRSLLFPYRVDEVCIHLEGGQEIRCSNLLIASRDLLLWLRAPLVTQYKWFI